MSGTVELIFKPSCLELNELQINFNKVIKTISLATSSNKNEKIETAILNYAEAFKIFGEYDPDHDQRDVCLSNIGSIMLMRQDFYQAAIYFGRAIENAE